MAGPWFKDRLGTRQTSALGRFKSYPRLHFMKVEDCLTHIDYAEDHEYLRRPLPNVNMRLFARSQAYRRLVRHACSLLGQHAITKMEGYKLPHGVSGANLGIGWNIIAHVVDRGTVMAAAHVMINPEITRYSEEQATTLSNCGSIRLEEPIQVRRSVSITVKYYDTSGMLHVRDFTAAAGAFTIQHEVDHNQGILIIDRASNLRT